jgi:hypothetical protein
MGLGNFQFWTQTPLDEHTSFAAREVISECYSKGDMGPTHRQHLLVEYRELPR